MLTLISLDYEYCNLFIFDTRFKKNLVFILFMNIIDMLIFLDFYHTRYTSN